VTCFGACLFKW